jgi:hypothetical protein
VICAVRGTGIRFLASVDDLEGFSDSINYTE